MKKLNHSSDSIARMFNNLCLNHVKDQLVENLHCFMNHVNPQSFSIAGDLFVFTQNRSFIVDESLNVYGIYLERCKILN